MKLKFQTPQGPQILSLGLAAGPTAMAGQTPTGVPGVAAMQILSGWGHGATAGLGGADWTAGCGTYRGEAYRMGPSFGQDSTDGKSCMEAGIGRLCSPSSPRGVWLLPWRLDLAPGQSSVQTLSLPVPGRLFALDMLVRRRPEGGDPCPCDLDGADDVYAGQWASRQITVPYPGLGSDTKNVIGAVSTNYNPNTEMVSARYYTAQRLLDGQNFLPPWVPNVDLANGNDQISWSVENGGLAPVTVQMTVHLMYGSFNLAAAVADYCEQRACEC